MAATAPNVGHSMFRYQLVVAALRAQATTITRLHADSETPGLQDYEVNFLKFMDRVTSGSSMEVRDQQQTVVFRPGVILGGTFAHTVPCSRSVTYIIEAALMLLPFAKLSSEITFLGATQNALDICPDTIRTVTLRWLQLFGVECSLRIVKRGAAPNGGGCVILNVTNVRKLRSVSILERGKVKRVRGISYSSQTAPDLPKQAATAAKGVLLNFLPDVYVVTDSYSAPGNPVGTAGYGVMLVTESNSKGCVLSQEAVAAPGETPEAVGQRAATLLLDQISEGGCVDAHHQALVLVLMSIAPDEISTVRFGRASPSLVSAMAMMETVFGVTCAIKEEASPYGARELPNSLIVSCMGSNLINVAKKSG